MLVERLWRTVLFVLQGLCVGSELTGVVSDQRHGLARGPYLCRRPMARCILKSDEQTEQVPVSLGHFDSFKTVRDEAIDSKMQVRRIQLLTSVEVN